MLEHAAHGVLLCIGVESSVHFAVRRRPGAFESPTFVDPFGGEGAEFVIGIGAFETIDVVALGLQLLSGKGGKRFAIVDVVGKCGIGRGFEAAGQQGVQALEHFGRDTHHAEGMPLRFGVGKEIVEHRGIVFTMFAVTVRFGAEGREIGGATVETKTHD